VQEALLKALRGFAAYESGTNFKEWLSDPSIVATRNVANVAQTANAIDAPNGAVDDIVTNSTQKISTTFFVEPKPDGFNIRDGSYSPLWQVSRAPEKSECARRPSSPKAIERAKEFFRGAPD